MTTTAATMATPLSTTMSAATGSTRSPSSSSSSSSTSSSKSNPHQHPNKRPQQQQWRCCCCSLRFLFTTSLVLLAVSLQVLRGFTTLLTTTNASPTFLKLVEEGILTDILTQALSSSASASAATTTAMHLLLNDTAPSSTAAASSSGEATATATTATRTVLSVAASPPRTLTTPNTSSSTTITLSSSSVGVQQQQQQQQPLLLFHEDALCVGCREQTVRKGKHASQSCGSLIYKHLQQLLLQQQQHGKDSSNINNNNSTQYNNLIRQATQNVLSMFKSDDECHLCRPQACREENKRYGYPDRAAPRVLHAQTLFLPSIPNVHRVPNPQLHNWTLYFSNTSHVHPHRTYFFEYNPSLVEIPRHQIPTQILTSQQVAETVYLASFRVTNTQQCVHGDDELLMIGGQWPRPKSQDYLGLALLRHDLSIIVDVVLDKNSPNNNHVLQGTEDYRLFVLNEQIYVASFHKIVPLWLVAPPALKAINTKRDDVVLLDNKFPSILTVHARTFASCAGNNGKNINYFVDDDSNNNSNDKTGAGVVVAEMYPMMGKMAVNLHEPCTPAASQRNQKGKSKEAAAAPQQQQQQQVRQNATLPLHKSFGSYEEIHFFNHGAFSTMSQERGSACCVHIPNPTAAASNSNSSSYLLLGISHSKTKFRSAATRDSLPGNVSANHFFSAFYAMDPHEPYTVRARSGRFCLGFSDVNETILPTTSSDNDNHNNNNPYARSNMVKLRLGGNLYDCPRIHFVSGMVEKANDPSRIIIAYGIQDCAPRFIEVAKQQILEMLFPDLFLESTKQ